MNGVTTKANGNLVRAGYCDFDYDSATEEYHTDVPEPAKVYGDRFFSDFHRWVDDQWVEISQPTLTFKLTGTSDKREIDTTNYKLFGLHREKVMNSSGLITEERYWKNYDDETYTFSDLVIRETVSYVIDPYTDVLSKRTKIIEWFYEGSDTAIGFTKTLIKYYSITEGIQIESYGREVLIEQAKEWGLLNIAGEYAPGILNAEHFLASVVASGAIDLFVQSIKQPLLDFINNSTETYMTQNIKDGLVGILDYD